MNLEDMDLEAFYDGFLKFFNEQPERERNAVWPIWIAYCQEVSKDGYWPLLDLYYIYKELGLIPPK